MIFAARPASKEEQDTDAKRIKQDLKIKSFKHRIKSLSNIQS
jgi:hypothetical protein